MPDFTETDSRTEVAALSHEVYRLTKQLEEQEQRHLNEAIPDKYDPFDNPTEYKGFGGDYSKILPRITEPGYEIPLEPDYSERRNLKRSYRLGGCLMLLRYLLSRGLIVLFIQLILYIMVLINPDADYNILSDYVSGSSIYVAVNMMIFIICNVGIALVGMKLAGIKYTSLVRSNDFGLGRAFQYCMIGVLLWTIAFYIMTGVNSVFSRYDMVAVPDTSGIGNTYFGKTVEILYMCLIAPITEELVFRGVLLRTLSKANQRFAIFASAIFFGLGHGNIKQFIFALLIGVFLAHITIKHGSIIPAVIVHIFVNTFSTVIGEVSGLSPYASLICYLVLLALALLGVILLLVLWGTDRLPSTTPKQARRGWFVAVGSIPFTASIAVLIINMIYILMKNN